MSNVPKELQEIAGLIGQMLGGNVNVEVLEVPKGKTIEEVVAQRKDPNWCEVCGEVHDDEPIDTKQAKAVTAIDKRIGRLENVIAKLRELQTSIATPFSEREPAQTMKEVLLAYEIERMTQAL